MTPFERDLMDRAAHEDRKRRVAAAWAKADASENALAAAWLEHDANLKAARELGPRPKKEKS